MKVKKVVSAIRSKRSSSTHRRSTQKVNEKKKTVPLRKLLKASWKHQGKIFFAESTLHGVRYIAETERPIIERLLWFICVMVGAISTMVIIMSLWEKFQTNPTITGLDTDFHNWDIPFPAVSLCPNQPWNTQRLHDYVVKMSEDHKLDNDTASRLTDFLKSLTQLSLNTLNVDDFQPEFDAILQGQDLHQVTYQLMDTCEDFLKECKWKADSYNCCDGFFPVFTENGFCFTFNSLHYEPQSPSGEDYPVLKRPLFIKETDTQWALQFYIESRSKSKARKSPPDGAEQSMDSFGSFGDFGDNSTNLGDDAIPELPPEPELEPEPEESEVEAEEVIVTYNVSMYLHRANELPGVNLRAQHVWDFKMASMSFSMRETYTTADATQLSIKQRHCIYDNEIKLEIDPTYSFAACTHQCRMNNARRLCGCIPHFYETINDHKHCDVAQLRCIAEKRQHISNIEGCGCELGCSNTIYEVDKLTEAAVPGSDSADDANQDLVGFEFEFTSWPMIKYKREVLFGWVDLLVSFGGIAGLFLGFSLLSGVEIVYYFTIRACCMVYKQRDELELMVNAPAATATKDYVLGLVPYFIKEPRPGQGRDMLRHRVKDATKIKPVMVKPVYPKTVMPPFGIDYYN